MDKAGSGHRAPAIPAEIDRRALIGMVPLLAGMASFPTIAHALAVTPRCRVIIDNDFSGDPDGLFQLAHHLACPSTTVPLIVGSHIHVNDFLDGSTTQADNAVRHVHAILSRMRVARAPEVVAGRNAALPPHPDGKPSAAAARIIAEARRTDTKLPLFYVAAPASPIWPRHSRSIRASRRG